MYEWHGFGGGIMWIFWILILVAIIWFMAISAHQRGDYKKPDKTALEILQERYAKGEISREEFKRMRDDINQ